MQQCIQGWLNVLPHDCMLTTGGLLVQMVEERALESHGKCASVGGLNHLRAVCCYKP